MPKIEAATVAEHHALMRQRLIDAAEELWRSAPGEPLTAARVSAEAGIARNSIYRYVDSVDDLPALVIERYLPDWTAAVTDALAGLPPAEQVVAWVRTNLERNVAVGHGWLMTADRLGSSGEASAAVTSVAQRAHDGVLRPLVEAWSVLLGPSPDRVALAVSITAGVLDGGFRELDRGRRTEDVVALTTAAARGVVTALATDAVAS